MNVNAVLASMVAEETNDIGEFNPQQDNVDAYLKDRVTVEPKRPTVGDIISSEAAYHMVDEYLKAVRQGRGEYVLEQEMRELLHDLISHVRLVDANVKCIVALSSK